MSMKADSDTKTAMKKRVDRRELLKFLAASPLLTSYSAFAQEAEEVLGERLRDPSEVINVFEMCKFFDDIAGAHSHLSHLYRITPQR